MCSLPKGCLATPEKSRAVLSAAQQCMLFSVYSRLACIWPPPSFSRGLWGTQQGIGSVSLHMLLQVSQQHHQLRVMLGALGDCGPWVHCISENQVPWVDNLASEP